MNMSDQRGYCTRIARRILEDTDHFKYYATETTKEMAKEIFEGLGLKVQEKMPLKDSQLKSNERLFVLEVHE